MTDYTCQAVISKDDDAEELCNEVAISQIGIPDTDGGLVVVYTCKEHEDKLDNGEAVMFAVQDLRYLIEFDEEEIENAT